MKISIKEFINKVCKLRCNDYFAEQCDNFKNNCCVTKNILRGFDIEVEQPKEDFEIDFEKAFDKKYTTLEQKYALESAYQKLLAKYNEMKGKK